MLEKQDFIKNPCLDFEDTDIEGNDITRLKFVYDDMADPVTCNEAETKWYFWDETWANLIGPYPSEDIARDMYKEYCQILDDADNA